jgi:phage shock protein C
MRSGRTFYLDRRNGKVMGVCAGIADYTGWDATLVRIGLVLLTLCGGFPWTLIAYAVAAWVAKPQPIGGYEAEGIVPRRSSAREVRDSMREIDRRMAEVETFVTHPNSSLAREIDSLR